MSDKRKDCGPIRPLISYVRAQTGGVSGNQPRDDHMGVPSADVRSQRFALALAPSMHLHTGNPHVCDQHQIVLFSLILESSFAVYSLSRLAPRRQKRCPARCESYRAAASGSPDSARRFPVVRRDFMWLRCAAEYSAICYRYPR